VVCTSIFFYSCTTGKPENLLEKDSNGIRISSDDTTLVNLFNWAKETSNGYIGNDHDPVGPWYEAALPNREAFCIRDVSHQSIGAEILWQGRQNLNMVRKFVENISESKDWCSYWEINRYNLPAPVDYRSDEDFWYNLNANFDIIDACWKLYQWTGNRTYIEDPAFDRFFRITLNEYLERWQLDPETIMHRPAFLNLKPDTRKYTYARGIPSYDEQQEDISVSGDLIGMIYNGFRTYVKMLETTGRADQAGPYEAKAGQYRKLIDSLWWDRDRQTYHGFYRQKDGQFLPGGLSNSEFLLWYQVIEKPERIERSLQELRNSQVEVLSYLPMLFYRYGYNRDAYDFLCKIYTDTRRMYPEASAGAIEGIVRGMMGIEPAATENRVQTCPRLVPETEGVTVENMPVFAGLISVSHESTSKTVFANKSDNNITWRAAFQGSFRQIRVDGKLRDALHFTDEAGNRHSYVDVDIQTHSQAVAEADTSQIVRNPKWPNLEEVILVWKTHNDIGYTHPVPEVLDYYRNGMMDKALKLIEDTLDTPRNERFVWVLPAWVMEVILDEKQSPERRTRIEKAIHDGRIVWHALPYTFESEAADLEELVRCLGSGTRLAKRFGQSLPTDAKLTDMPSQAWVLPTLLTHAGIKFVHIGVNPWSPNPDVPNLFWWEGPDGSRLLTGYAFHSYSWEPLPPEGWKHKTWLCFQVTGDNSGPPSPTAVKRVLDQLRRELPGVKIRFGRPGDFADAIIAEKSTDIPVIRGDMPDTWTHGQMTMPVPTQIHRQAATAMVSLGVLDTELRAWNAQSRPFGYGTVDSLQPAPGNRQPATSNQQPETSNQQPATAESLLASAYEQGSLYTEHTWGIAGPMFGSPDHATWKFELAAGKYDSLLGTFKWHAGYVRKAMKLTSEGIRERMHFLAASVEAQGPRVVVFNPLPWTMTGLTKAEIPAGEPAPAALKDLESGTEIPISIEDLTVTFICTDIPPGGYKTYVPVSPEPADTGLLEGNTLETKYFKVTFDPVRGGISSLVTKTDNRQLITPNEFLLGQYIHEQFSKKDVDAFLKAYCHVYYDWYGFPYYDFNKPRLDSTLPYKLIKPAGWTLKTTREPSGCRTVMTTRNTEGLAEQLSLTFFFPDYHPVVDITWSIKNKTPELIPEGGWICVPLAAENPAFRVSHVSAPFTPEKDLVPGTNAHLFSIDYGISVRNGENGTGAAVSSSDLPLWSIGEPGLWKYSPRWEPRKPVLFANLFNNQWNTNYPLWIDGSWSATLRIWPVTDGASEEETLFTPAWEFRQGLLSGYASGEPGPLPVTQAGLSLSRKGIRVTAFCPNPDAEKGVEGILLRIWEQSGRAGEVAVTLPAGFEARKAQPVSLRGEKAGKPIRVLNGKMVFTVKAYAPASFVLN
jgi:hypothetical protein